MEVATSWRGSCPGFRLTDRPVPGGLVVERHGLRLAAPALAALDLSNETTEAIDQVLRTRAATLDGLWEAFELTRGRRGNEQRLRHLIDSRDEPWSAAERRCHRLLDRRALHLADADRSPRDRRRDHPCCAGLREDGAPPDISRVDLP